MLEDGIFPYKCLVEGTVEVSTKCEGVGRSGSKVQFGAGGGVTRCVRVGVVGVVGRKVGAWVQVNGVKCVWGGGGGECWGGGVVGD